MFEINILCMNQVWWFFSYCTSSHNVGKMCIMNQEGLLTSLTFLWPPCNGLYKQTIDNITRKYADDKDSELKKQRHNNTMVHHGYPK